MSADVLQYHLFMNILRDLDDVSSFETASSRLHDVSAGSASLVDQSSGKNSSWPPAAGPPSRHAKISQRWSSGSLKKAA